MNAQLLRSMQKAQLGKEDTRETGCWEHLGASVQNKGKVLLMTPMFQQVLFYQEPWYSASRTRLGSWAFFHFPISSGAMLFGASHWSRLKNITPILEALQIHGF